MPRALMKERNLAALKSVPKFGMTGRSSGPLELDKYLIGHHLNAARIGAVDPPRPDRAKAQGADLDRFTALRTSRQEME
jgi:hypothetical protein